MSLAQRDSRRPARKNQSASPPFRVLLRGHKGVALNGRMRDTARLGPNLIRSDFPVPGGVASRSPLDGTGSWGYPSLVAFLFHLRAVGASPRPRGLFAGATLAGLLAFSSGTTPAGIVTDPVAGHVERGGAWIFDDPFPSNGRRATGLQHAFPAMPGADANPLTPEKVELGRLLFFDPVMSGDNTVSCATCHHPDFGLADGRPLAMGVGGRGFGPARQGGRELSRNTPALWNAGFNEWQFWDGRVRELEAQAVIPMSHPDEMGQDPEQLVAELRAIPEYVERFESAFSAEGPTAVTLDHTVQALAGFERTLLSFNSRFDRYAAGDFTALNESEKNGLKLFRSLHTRCFECHSFPTFSDSSFRVLGVPDSGRPDLGRGGVMERSADASFRVPSLRNVELTAPYMHNGSLPTLEEVVKFYSEGGGRREAEPIPGIDDKIQTFDLSPEESADLVAFMKALTDTSMLPRAPDRVPSGLPVVAVASRPLPAPPRPRSPAAPISAGFASLAARAVRPEIRRSARAERPLEIVPTAHARSLAGGMHDGAGSAVPAATFHIGPDQSIQAALERARPGDRMELADGVYAQSVEIRIEDLTLAGTTAEGERAVLDGEGTRETGVSVFAKGLKLESLTLRRYVKAGVNVEGTDMPSLEDVRIEE